MGDNQLIIIGTAIAFGFILGVAWKDRKSDQLHRDQQERGDYWFNKYQGLLKYGENCPEDYSFLEDPNNDDEDEEE